MAFRFQSANCVASGTFNVYVLQPDLLKELGLFPNPEPTILMEANLTQPGFRFSSNELNTMWEIRPDRVIVQTHDNKKDCCADLAVVLSALKWTPLNAVGMNIKYEVIDEQCPSWLNFDNDVRTRLNNEPYALEQSTFHVQLRRDRYLFNIQVCKRGDGLEVNCNVHSEAPAKQSQSQYNEYYVQVLKDLPSVRVDLQLLLQNLFSIEISDDNNSNANRDDNFSRHSA